MWVIDEENKAVQKEEWLKLAEEKAKQLQEESVAAASREGSSKQAKKDKKSRVSTIHCPDGRQVCMFVLTCMYVLCIIRICIDPNQRYCSLNMYVVCEYLTQFGSYVHLCTSNVTIADDTAVHSPTVAI